MMLMSVIYISYITQMTFYESVFLRRIETINECTLLGMVYHWLAFANPWIYEDYELMTSLGKSVIFFIVLLLGFNTVIILWVNIKAVHTYCRRRLIRKKLLKQAEERKMAALNADKYRTVEAKLKVQNQA